MNGTRISIIGLVPLLIMLITSAILYPGLPEQIPSISSNPDDTQSKLVMAVLMPAIYSIILIIIVLMVNFSPKEFSMPNSRNAAGTLIFGTGILLCFCHYASINHHGEFDFFVNFFTWGMVVFLIVAGNVMGKTERNFMLGIRLPWTMSSEANWRATHRFAGRLMVAAGILLGILNIWINNLGLTIGAIVIPMLVVAVYSYRYYALNESGQDNGTD